MYLSVASEYIYIGKLFHKFLDVTIAASIMVKVKRWPHVNFRHPRKIDDIVKKDDRMLKIGLI